MCYIRVDFTVNLALEYNGLHADGFKSHLYLHCGDAAGMGALSLTGIFLIAVLLKKHHTVVIVSAVRWLRGVTVKVLQLLQGTLYVVYALCFRRHH